jgi:hypothetical protein
VALLSVAALPVPTAVDALPLPFASGPQATELLPASDAPPEPLAFTPSHWNAAARPTGKAALASNMRNMRTSIGARTTTTPCARLRDGEPPDRQVILSAAPCPQWRQTRGALLWRNCRNLTASLFYRGPWQAISRVH